MFSERETKTIINDEVIKKSKKVLQSLTQLKKSPNITANQAQQVEQWIECIRDLGDFSDYKLKQIDKFCKSKTLDSSLFKELKAEYFPVNKIENMREKAKKNNNRNQVVWFYEECE